MNDEEGLEIRPALKPQDTRMAQAALAGVRSLRARYPDAHICCSYDHPLWIVVHATAHDGTALAEEWVAK